MHENKKIIRITDSYKHDKYKPVYIEYNPDLSLNENLDKIDKLDFCHIPLSVLKRLMDKLKTNNYNISTSYIIENDDGVGCDFHINIISLTPIIYDDNYIEIKSDTNIHDVSSEYKKEIINHLDEETAKWIYSTGLARKNNPNTIIGNSINIYDSNDEYVEWFINIDENTSFEYFFDHVVKYATSNGNYSIMEYYNIWLHERFGKTKAFQSLNEEVCRRFIIDYCFENWTTDKNLNPQYVPTDLEVILSYLIHYQVSDCFRLKLTNIDEIKPLSDWFKRIENNGN